MVVTSSYSQREDHSQGSSSFPTVPFVALLLLCTKSQCAGKGEGMLQKQPSGLVHCLSADETLKASVLIDDDHFGRGQVS